MRPETDLQINDVLHENEFVSIGWKNLIAFLGLLFKAQNIVL